MSDINVTVVTTPNIITPISTPIVVNSTTSPVNITSSNTSNQVIVSPLGSQGPIGPAGPPGTGVVDGSGFISTGMADARYVNLSTNQSITGIKSFINNTNFVAVTIATGNQIYSEGIVLGIQKPNESFSGLLYINSDGNITFGGTQSLGKVTLNQYAHQTDASPLVLYNTAGGSNSSVSLDFYNTTVHANIPQCKIKAIDDGDFSSNLVFYSKEPGSSFNSLIDRMTLYSNGEVFIRGDIRFICEGFYAPSSPTDNGMVGQMIWDSNYLYICIADNTWRRTTLSSW